MAKSDKNKIKNLAAAIRELVDDNPITLMEVCGTHTMAIARYGIKSLLPPSLDIVSGPGCPVCVTSAQDIQFAIDLANQKDCLVATFGDMIKVPGESSNLGSAQNVEVVYSPFDALEMAEQNPGKEIVLLGLGFETTTPLIASLIKSAASSNLGNFSVLPMHKLVPPALELLISDPDSKLNGFILPGHVSAVTGTRYFKFLETTGIGGVVSGFTPLDIMESIYVLIADITAGRTRVLNNYERVVRTEGNPKAFNLIWEVYEPEDSKWRGIGTIPTSGLSIREKYADFDANCKFELKKREVEEPIGCICGEILMGRKKPNDCKHFGKSCTPLYPVGPCMVSSEGTCAAWYKYNKE
ncbi:MAG: hydrogenase formation protein HypD [Myxococcota bacterium]